MSAPRPERRRPGGTLYRYIIREMVFPTLYALGGLTLVVLTKDLLGYSDLVINRGLDEELKTRRGRHWEWPGEVEVPLGVGGSGGNQ